MLVDTPGTGQHGCFCNVLIMTYWYVAESFNLLFNASISVLSQISSPFSTGFYWVICFYLLNLITRRTPLFHECCHFLGISFKSTSFSVQGDQTVKLIHLYLHENKLWTMFGQFLWCFRAFHSSQNREMTSPHFRLSAVCFRLLGTEKYFL